MRKTAAGAGALRRSLAGPESRGQLVRRPDGVMVRLVPMDPHGPTFDDDLTEVFQRNVAKARRENKKLFGSPDGLTPKE